MQFPGGVGLASMWLTDHDWCFYVVNYCIVSDFWQWIAEDMLHFLCMSWMITQWKLACRKWSLVFRCFHFCLWHLFGILVLQLSISSLIDISKTSVWVWDDLISLAASSWHFICNHLSLGKTKANQPRLMSFYCELFIPLHNKINGIWD